MLKFSRNIVIYSLQLIYDSLQNEKCIDVFARTGLLL